jgi:hypothetical protein
VWDRLLVRLVLRVRRLAQRVWDRLLVRLRRLWPHQPRQRLQVRRLRQRQQQPLRQARALLAN